MSDNPNVNHPSHYGGKDNPYEAIKVIEAWTLGFHLGNTVKYVSRFEHKGVPVQDLDKALWYLRRRLRLSALPLPPRTTVFGPYDTYHHDKVIAAWGLDVRLGSVVTAIATFGASPFPMGNLEMACLALNQAVKDRKVKEDA